MKKRMGLLCLCLLLAVAGCGAEPEASSSEPREPDSLSEGTAGEGEEESEASEEEVSSEAEPLPEETEPAASSQAESSVSEQSLEVDSSQADTEALSFRGETVTAVYSLDYANRSYHLVVDGDEKAVVLRSLEGLEPQAASGQELTGFLVFTERNKYDYYFPAQAGTGDEAMDALIDASLRINGSAPGHVQWLVYMSASRIQEISFGALGGEGYTNGKYSDYRDLDIGVVTSDPGTVGRIDAFLKTIPVEPAPFVSAEGVNPNMPASLYSMQIQFENGVRYHIFGYESDLTIWSSDMTGTITYTCTEQSIRSLRDFMADLQFEMLRSGQVEAHTGTVTMAVQGDHQASEAKEGFAVPFTITNDSSYQLSLGPEYTLSKVEQEGYGMQDVPLAYAPGHEPNWPSAAYTLGSEESLSDAFQFGQYTMDIQPGLYALSKEVTVLDHDGSPLKSFTLRGEFLLW